MKHPISILIFIILTANTFANVNYIDIAKISNDNKYVLAFNFIKDNERYYNQWSPETKGDIAKENLIKKLQECYATFSAVTFRNTEVYLLLGDISHYLYNLNDSAAYQKAVTNYKSAIGTSPKDYRCYWFLGYHFAQSNVPTQAVDNFLKAEELLPAEQPVDFWNDYAWTSMVTNMPSHCIYAMEKAKSISGVAASFERQLGDIVHKKIVPVDKEQLYKKEDLWSASKGEKITFVSRPLGMKILIDPTWKISVTDFKNHQSAFIINPPPLKNKKGTDIDYTIALIMKTANDNENLADFINNFVSKHPNKSKITFSDKYDKMIAYEIKDETMYQNIGGGHLYMIGIERTVPKYPGLLLENPVPITEGTAGKISYYTATKSQDRFKGKIFYGLMLDSCEDISEKSLTVFKTMFEQQIIIE